MSPWITLYSISNQSWCYYQFWGSIPLPANGSRPKQKVYLPNVRGEAPYSLGSWWCHWFMIVKMEVLVLMISLLTLIANPFGLLLLNCFFVSLEHVLGWTLTDLEEIAGTTPWGNVRIVSHRTRPFPNNQTMMFCKVYWIEPLRDVFCESQLNQIGIKGHLECRYLVVLWDSIYDELKVFVLIE